MIASTLAAMAAIVVAGIGRATFLSSHDRDRMSGFPRLILWAWERPERLGFIDPREVGVAFLARTLRLQQDRIIVQERHQPLDVPQQTALIAVVRIETRNAAMSEGQRAQIVASVVELAQATRVSAIQIDFDALVSEREFYRQALKELRLQLPPEVRLSITALASWCIFDGWIRDLPVDEAVPMLFRMGRDAERIERHLKSGGDFSVDASRHSLGVSTDEPLQGLRAGRRIYVFSPEPWSEDAVKKVIEETKQWQ